MGKGAETVFDYQRGKVGNSPVLVIGASGFVGRHLCVALEAAGHAVRRGTSNRALAATGNPDSAWTLIDMNDPQTHGKALAGCRSVVYLFHALGSGPDYAKREANAAARFREAASASHIERIAYLGGVAPLESTSQHLESRRATGQLLRGSDVPTIELRAAMIIGKGSTSFNLVRDLAVRAPWLALPKWLDQGSCPVAIDDVVYAILRSLEADLPAGGYFDLPGPEWITHRDLLARLSSLVGTKVFKHPLPWISTRLAARVLGLITRERAPVVAELVAGLPSDLSPVGQSFWDVIGETPAYSIMTAILNALADETSEENPSSVTRERIAARVRARRLP